MTNPAPVPPPPAVLRGKLCEIAALEHYLIELLVSQQVDPALRAQPETLRFVSRTLAVLHQHASRLVALLETVPGGPAEFTQTTVAMADRFAAYQRKPAARDAIAVLQEDNSMLNLAASHYTVLHATALAVGEQAIAGLALTHLRDLTPRVMEISRLIPLLAVQSVGSLPPAGAAAAFTAALRNTEEAWRKSSSPPPSAPPP